MYVMTSRTILVSYREEFVQVKILVIDPPEIFSHLLHLFLGSVHRP